VIEFSIKENSSAADIFDRLSHVFGVSCMDVTSVWLCVKHIKDGNRDFTD
jgi:hypothetical protein